MLNAQSGIVLEPELRGGLIVPNADFYPDPGFQKELIFNIASLGSSDSIRPNAFFAPHGVQLAYCHYGNQAVFGQSFQIVPFLGIKASQKPGKDLHFRFGLGASYFDNHYKIGVNERNKSIGSKWNWNFQAFMYFRLSASERRIFNIGAGYSHHSNAHTTLPNFGLNSALLCLSYQFLSEPYSELKQSWERSRVKDNSKVYELSIRQGYGVHEFGGTIGPVGGEKKGVYTSATSLNIRKRKFLKLSAGLAYRRYEHFRNYIDSVRPEEFIDQPDKASSNLFFFLGVEIFTGHFGVEMNGGLNLYKPFHDTYNDVFENSTGLGYLVKRYFPSRLALNAYLRKPANLPAWNFSISPAINANFGEADFMEINAQLYFRLGESEIRNKD